MNVHQKIVIITGFVFIGFIIILALVDFNNVILGLGLLAVIAVISGTVKVLLLNEKRKQVTKELEDFQKVLDSKRPKKPPKEVRYKYYCPLCLHQSNKFAEKCPSCEKGKMIKARKKEGRKKEEG